MPWGVKKSKHKYGATSVVVDGIKFDSKLERFAYDLLKKFNVPFSFQQLVVLQPKFRDEHGAMVREIKCFVDFVVSTKHRMYFIDTKGYATDTSKMKYKMLKHRFYSLGVPYEVVFLKTKKSVTDFVLQLQDDIKHNRKEITNEHEEFINNLNRMYYEL